jgi:D-alanyl-D-alanine carboxypeptidase/D-alanyl-D-alanine-endopeptidase (penicillin-binding protein 4)
MKKLLAKTIAVKHIAIFLIATGAIITPIILLTKKDTTKNISVDSPDNVNRDSVTIPEKKDLSPLGQLNYYIDSIVNCSELKNAGFGFCLFDPDSNRIILSHNEHQALVPASVMKTVTTGVALGKLGGGYRFTTRLQYDGEIDKSTRTLKGNIYIMGGGDPSLASEVFYKDGLSALMNSWAAAIQNLGIDSINGNIVGDASAYELDQIPVGWSWEDMQSDYAVGPCGLSICENMYDISISATNGYTSYKVKQDVPGMKLHNQVYANANLTKSYAFVNGAPFMNERILLGEVNGYYEGRSALPDPALFCAYSLFKKLKNNGIKISDTSTTYLKLKFEAKNASKKERKTFYTYHSPSLAQLVYHTNKVSQNFYAETLLRLISIADGNYGSTAGGVNGVINYFKQKKVDLHGFFMVDGSGVSRYDALSTKFLCDMLLSFKNDSSMFNSFYNSLPVSGQSGTLRRMADDSLANGKVHAKSGYMTRVRSYAGYVTSQKERTLIFAMIMNNQGWDAAQTKLIMERIMELMAALD